MCANLQKMCSKMEIQQVIPSSCLNIGSCFLFSKHAKDAQLLNVKHEIYILTILALRCTLVKTLKWHQPFPLTNIFVFRSIQKNLSYNVIFLCPLAMLLLSSLQFPSSVVLYYILDSYTKVFQMKRYKLLIRKLPIDITVKYILCNYRQLPCLHYI